MFAARLALIVPLLLLGLPAQAQEVEVGTTLVCDTQAQVERFVALYDEDEQSAVDAVNAEVHDVCLLRCSLLEQRGDGESVSAQSTTSTTPIIPLSSWSTAWQ